MLFKLQVYVNYKRYNIEKTEKLKMKTLVYYKTLIKPTWYIFYLLPSQIFLLPHSLSPFLLRALICIYVYIYICIYVIWEKKKAEIYRRFEKNGQNVGDSFIVLQIGKK